MIDRDILISHFRTRLTVLRMDERGPLLAAYECYLTGHIAEGFALLGIAYTGQSAAALKAALDAAVRGE